MSAFVPAVSVTAAWLFDDEDEPCADAALTHLLTHLKNDAALATLDTGSPEPPPPEPSSPEPPSPKGSY